MRPRCIWTLSRDSTTIMRFRCNVTIDAPWNNPPFLGINFGRMPFIDTSIEVYTRLRIRQCWDIFVRYNQRRRIVPLPRLTAIATRTIIQPQRIHPPRRVRHVLVVVQPTRQLDRVRGQETAGVGIVVTMPVVVQAGFRVVVLPLEAQRVVDFRHFQAGDVAVGAVAGRPEDFAAVAGQFLRSAQVVEW